MADTNIQPPTPPALPATADELYDQLMSAIEAELTTSQLPLLKEKYKDETKEQAAERSQRYANAFNAFEANLQTHEMEVFEVLRSYRKQAFASIEAENAVSEQKVIDTLIQNFS